jgi:hypothetical protein
MGSAMKALTPILFVLFGVFGFGWAICHRLIRARLRAADPNLSASQSTEAAIRASPADFDDPEMVSLATWMRRFAIGLGVDFLLFIANGVVAWTFP